MSGAHMKKHMGFLPQTGEFSAIGLDLPDTLTAEQWREAGLEIARTSSASRWWLGDWWRFGEHRYGERKAIVESEDWDGPAFETCKQAGMAAAAFETCRRRHLLSFNHHREVISLPVEWQDNLLDEAEKRSLSIAKLRQRVKEVKAHAAQGWSPDQEARRAKVEAGGTVLANMSNGPDGLPVDRALINWADAQGRLQRIDRQSDWGNPFILGPDGDRATVIESFRIYFDRKLSLHKRLGELRGKVLACWCCPESCHGDVLIEKVEQHDL